LVVFLDVLQVLLLQLGHLPLEFVVFLLNVGYFFVLGSQPPPVLFCLGLQLLLQSLYLQLQLNALVACCREAVAFSCIVLLFDCALLQTADAFVFHL
jgi:uncharacterized membrane protein